ncbi:hypothetical protein GCM10023314_13380 [Algibacter agarivorans]|uniref:Uncharacterized protein n=1 Tax=Algibacter agarivorans TaxID=1109741 RepID=A0ABP9GMN5_9FLAO
MVKKVQSTTINMALNVAFNAVFFSLNNNYKLLLLLYIVVKISIFLDLAKDCGTKWSRKDAKAQSEDWKIMGCFAEMHIVFYYETKSLNLKREHLNTATETETETETETVN